MGDLLRAGLRVCLNSGAAFLLSWPLLPSNVFYSSLCTSDDPAFFGGYVCANYERAALDCSLGRQELWQLAWNSIELAFCSAEDRARWQAELLALRPTPSAATT